MADEPKPHILIVDDEDTAQHTIGLDSLAAPRARHPNDVTSEDLAWADLVLMDFVISKWDERDQLDQVSLQPLNGLALAAVLREHVDADNQNCHNYTAFAIHSAQIDKISERLHTTNRIPHVVSRLNNLEWAFDKADSARFKSSAVLATAVRDVSRQWSDVEKGGISVATSRLLNLNTDAPWRERAADDVVLCQIPLSDLSAGTNGLLFLRWLLHGILPYPTFLLAMNWVAARLRIKPASLRDVLLGSESQLGCDLEECRYKGVLDAFVGHRWWRAAVDQYIWDLRADGAREPDEFHRELEKRAGRELELVEEVSPVVCVDRELRARDGLWALENVVRLVPDLWPTYADPAYAEAVEVSENPALCSIVHPLDRERVPALDEEE